MTHSFSYVTVFATGMDKKTSKIVKVIYERVLDKRACSSAGLERTPDKREVGGSSPPRPTKTRFMVYG